MAVRRAGGGLVGRRARSISVLRRSLGVPAETFWVWARSGDHARRASDLLIFGGLPGVGGQAAGSARIRARAAR
jgi:hypothetical protein